MHSALLLLSAQVLWASATAQAVAGDPAQTALDSISITNIEDVRGNLHLPTTSEGLKITWSSSDPSVISADGIVQRQHTQIPVNLTATIALEWSYQGEGFPGQCTDSRQLDSFEGYAFAYFTNNSKAGENIYLAASDGNDALSWTELNNKQPILTSTEGTKGLRDPFVIRSPEGDVFYLLATDLSIGSGTSWSDAVRIGSLYLEIWESTDLKTWSQQRHVKVSPSTAGNTWAPEAYYDSTIGSYVVFWASSLYQESDVGRNGTTYHRMLYVTTRDFVIFSEPTVWQDAGMSRIDSTVLEENGSFYRFTKDEGGGGTGCTDIIEERSSSLRAPLDSWTQVVACIGKNAGTSNVEGPTSFKSNPGDVHGDKFYLFVDEYTDRGYIPLETIDIANPEWKVSPLYKLPTSPRHGTVIPITAKELAALTTTSDTAAKSGSPILPGLYADPNIIIFGDTYYIYATTDGIPGWGGNTFYVWSSPDLITWTRSSEPFLTLNGTSGNVPWATGNAWAPTIISRNGSYYLYFSGQNPTYNRKTIGVAVSSSPTGPFTAQPLPFILNNEPITTSQAIDSAAFQDPTSGKFYLFWGNGDAPLYAELADDMLSLKPNSTRVIAGLTDFREGLFVNYRNGTFHLTYSVDDTRSENYRIGYATSASVDGPWTYRGILLENDVEKGILGTGHNSIVNVPCSDDWMAIGTRRETVVDRVYFDDEGVMKKIVPTLEGVEAQRIGSC